MSNTAKSGLWIRQAVFSNVGQRGWMLFLRSKIHAAEEQLLAGEGRTDRGTLSRWRAIDGGGEASPSLAGDQDTGLGGAAWPVDPDPPPVGSPNWVLGSVPLLVATR